MASSSDPNQCRHRRYWILNHHLPGGDCLGNLRKSPSASELWRCLTLRNGCLHLVLGIQSGGASFLLVDESESHKLSVGRAPIPGCHFLSLSPIHFRDISELDAKLAGYLPIQRARKKVAALSPPPANILNFMPSIFNKLDYLTNATNTSDTEGPERVAFEQNRLLYHLLVGDVEPFRYCLTKQNSLGRIRLLALAVNYAMVDDPASTILDVAWQTIRTEQGRALKPDSIQYYKVDGHTMLTKQDCLGGGTQAPSEFRYGPTEQVVQLEDIGAALRAELRYDGPTILICWSWRRELVSPLREAFEIPVDAWRKNLGGLLGFGIECHERRKGKRPEPERQVQQSHKARDPRIRPQMPQNSRSHSPNRDGPREQRHPEDRSVYVVDLQVMYDTMRGLRYPSMHTVAMELGFPTEKGWCAGNECWFLFQAWKSLASGTAIDDRCREIIQNLNLHVEVESPPMPNGPVVPNRPVEAGGLFDEDGQDTASENNESTEQAPLESATGHDSYAHIDKRYQGDSESDYD